MQYDAENNDYFIELYDENSVLERYDPMDLPENISYRNAPVKAKVLLRICHHRLYKALIQIPLPEDVLPFDPAVRETGF